MPGTQYAVQLYKCPIYKAFAFHKCFVSCATSNCISPL